ncbi:hypothetical protein TNCV_180381 [Trichonephila clavipes]|nr:hypothetical protein TNCV_180381 [Trichonephila clavipes]
MRAKDDDPVILSFGLSYEDDTQDGTTPKLPHHANEKTLRLINLTCIAPSLHTSGLQWRKDSSPRHSDHEFVTVTTRLPREFHQISKGNDQLTGDVKRTSFQGHLPEKIDQRASRKFVTSKQKAFWVLQFSKTESTITVQRAFRIKLGCQPRNDNILSDEAHFCLNGYVNKQNCRIWSEANQQVYVETPLHPEKLTGWCALWAGGILLQKR